VVLAEGGGHVLKNVLVAVYGGSLCPDSSYRALLNPDILWD
jgi:hypothetical protein